MGSDIALFDAHSTSSISIHAPRMGSDRAFFSPYSPQAKFQSTLPAWGATDDGAGRVEFPQISIHAPRMGSDQQQSTLPAAFIEFQSTLPAWGATITDSGVWTRNGNFNPRSPHGERPGPIREWNIVHQFQSTLPAWGATGRLLDLEQHKLISIHAPRMGSDSLGGVIK